jgi:hypothetical protein
MQTLCALSASLINYKIVAPSSQSRIDRRLQRKQGMLDNNASVAWHMCMFITRHMMMHHHDICSLLHASGICTASHASKLWKTGACTKCIHIKSSSIVSMAILLTCWRAQYCIIDSHKTACCQPDGLSSTIAKLFKTRHCNKHRILALVMQMSSKIQVHPYGHC